MVRIKGEGGGRGDEEKKKGPWNKGGFLVGKQVIYRSE